MLVVQERGEYLQIANTDHTWNMDVWLQRTKFRERLKAYQEATGKTQAQAAEDLGVELGSLRFWLYQKKRKPSFDTLQKAAILFKCSVTEFLDDPGATPAGIEAQRWSEISERDRVIASAMFADITADQLTEAEKDELEAARRFFIPRYSTALHGNRKKFVGRG